MEIRTDYFTNIILHSTEITYSNCNVNVLAFDEVYLLTGSDMFLPNMLNVGFVSQLPKHPPENTVNTIFICIEDVPVPSAYKTAAGISLFVCSPSTTLQSLFNEINTLFFGISAATNNLWNFMDMIAGESTFTQLMTAASKILRCSCAILSQGLKLLGYCEYEESGASSTWILTTKKKYYPYPNLITRLSSKGLTFSDPETHRISDSLSDSAKEGDAFFPLISKDSSGEVLGYLYFSYVDPNIFPSMHHIISFIAYSLEFRMWRYINSPANANSVLCFLFRDILSGAIHNDEDIRERLDNILVTLPANMFLITIYTSAVRNRKVSFAHLKVIFGQVFPDDVLFTYNGDILLLVGSDSEIFSQEKTTLLSQALIDNDCYAGISENFTYIDRSLKNHYSRTLAAAKMARSYEIECHFSFFGDVAMLYLIQGNFSSINIRDLCDPRILHLATYDQAHNSNYVTTLQCYWSFNQNVQRTCEYLYIHRNTLFYRLKKIKEIVNLDFANVRHLIQFQLSFAILTALGDIPLSPFPAPFLAEYDVDD